MAADDGHEVQEVSGVATLIIPSDLVQQVVDYIATLNAEDADVSGYMINIGSGLMQPVTATMSGCLVTCHGLDVVCDTDSTVAEREA